MDLNCNCLVGICSAFYANHSNYTLNVEGNKFVYNAQNKPMQHINVQNKTLEISMICAYDCNTQHHIFISVCFSSIAR